MRVFPSTPRSRKGASARPLRAKGSSSIDPRFYLSEGGRGGSKVMSGVVLGREGRGDNETSAAELYDRV